MPDVSSAFGLMVSSVCAVLHIPTVIMLPCVVTIICLAEQETEPLDIIIVRKGLRSTGEAYILLRMPIQVELVLRKNKTYIGKRYVEVNLAKKLVSVTRNMSTCVVL